MLPLGIREEELEANLEYCLSRWQPLVDPPDDVRSFLRAAHATHTFAYSKMVDGEQFWPYEDILDLETRYGLLSDRYREEQGLFRKGERRRDMPIARELGLDSYVFSYLGAHEPYYARDEAIDSRPVGVFIKRESETVPRSHASFRDAHADGNQTIEEKRKELLSCTGARKLAAYQVTNDPAHKRSIHHYWGDSELLGDPEYMKNSWRKKLEFRHYNCIKLEEIEALLWPEWVEVRGPNSFTTMSQTPTEVKDFCREYDCPCIIYTLDHRLGERSFLEASIVASMFFDENGRFPDKAELAERVGRS